LNNKYATILGVLALAFFLRVLGQFLVAFFRVDFLPPMDEWYSGLIPYPVLLPIQLAILAVQAKISWDLYRGSGVFAKRRPRAGTVLCWLSYLYFSVMVLRYIVTMYLYPERRCFGGAIPIFFHWVLAAYLFVLARFQVLTDRENSSP
jgi:hypothetical protein